MFGILGEDNTRIEIVENNAVYSAKIISSDNAKAKIGAQFLKAVKLDGKAWKGKLYSAKRGKWYDVTITRKGDQVFATIDAGLMSKTLEWTKE